MHYLRNESTPRFCFPVYLYMQESKTRMKGLNSKAPSHIKHTFTVVFKRNPTLAVSLIHWK